MRDVTVIGGGPAGLWLAYRLACDGFDVVVLDDRNSIGDRKICTGIVSPETFDRFQLPRDLILSNIQELRFFSPLGSELQYMHPTVLAHVVDRTALDKAIAQMATAKGVEIRTGKRVKKVIARTDCIQVEAESVLNPNERELLEGKIVAVATGVNTRLNKPLGLGVPNAFLNAAQAHVNVRNLDSTLCYVGRNLAPGAFGWLVPLDRDRGRVGLMAEGNVAHFFEKFLRTTAKHIVTPLEKIEVSVKPIAQGFAGKTYANRVIAVGEAAGHIKTTTGGGIYYGLLCADLATEIIRNALLSDRYDERFLYQYEEKWKKEINQELKLGYVFRKAFGKLSDRQIERLFSLARTNGILPLVRTTARFDWHAELLRSLARYAAIQKIFGMDLSKVF